MSATGRAPQAGFTLIECLAVLAITALASAIAFPSLEMAMHATALTQSREALIANLRQARGLALAGGEPEALVVRPDGGAYGWNGRMARGLPSGVTVRQEAGGIAFYPDGSTIPGRLVLSSGARRVIVAVSSTGVVSETPPAAATTSPQ
jgi:prepilin-type N-terminal cleavage/methylation domain-containing protein